MMKKYLTGLIFVFFVCSSSIGKAQELGTLYSDSEWGIFGSYWSPQDADDTFGVGLKVAFGIAPHARLDFRATYYDKISYVGDSFRADLHEVPLEGGLQFYGNAGPIEMFLGFGLGYYYTDGEVYLIGDRASETSFDDEFGYYANAGFEIPLTEEVSAIGASRLTLYLDVGYRFVELNQVKIGKQTFYSDEANLSGINGTAGLMLHW